MYCLLTISCEAVENADFTGAEVVLIDLGGAEGLEVEMDLSEWDVA